MSYTGLIKGAICYGLTLEVFHETKTENGKTVHVFDHDVEPVIHSTTLSMVFLTTLIFGSFMQPVRKLLLGGAKEEQEDMLARRARNQVDKTEKIDTFDDILLDLDDKEKKARMSLENKI